MVWLAQVIPLPTNPLLQTHLDIWCFLLNLPEILFTWWYWNVLHVASTWQALPKTVQSWADRKKHTSKKLQVQLIKSGDATYTCSIVSTSSYLRICAVQFFPWDKQTLSNHLGHGTGEHCGYTKGSYGLLGPMDMDTLYGIIQPHALADLIVKVTLKMASLMSQHE